MTDKKEFCCETMEYYVLDEPEDFLEYDVITRRHSIHISGPEFTIIKFCPWCGARLPKDLNDEWIDILVEEYDLESPCNHDKDKVPPEFKTEEWWKKRGL